MDEYDRSARLHSLNDPHRQYLQSVQTLKNNAVALNRNVIKSLPAAAENVIRENGMAINANHAPHDGDKMYKPHEEHFGYRTPLDFVDSFDPYMATSTATSSSAPVGAVDAPPLAKMPNQGYQGEMVPGVGPAPISSGRKG